MNIAVIGLSHKTAPVEVREKLSIPETEIQNAITQLCSGTYTQEVGILSTCNRLEIYVVTNEMQPGIKEVTQFLSNSSKVPLKQLRPHLFILLHEDSIMHLMRVAAGLDSLVLGEGQILAQVKQTYKLGQKYKGIGRILNRLFKQAVTAGKRVRTETSIGTGAVSISSAAVELAQMKLEDLSNYRVAIVGAGKMSKLLVQHLLAKGANNISIINRSVGRAQDLVNSFKDADINVYSMLEMGQVIGKSNLVFTSTGATELILDKAKLEKILDPLQAIMLVDISVPRNIATNVSKLPNVRCFNVDDLKAVVAQNQESRRQMAMEAEVLLEEEVEAFDVWWKSLETVPTINSLRQKIETIREQELEKALSRLGSEFAEKHQEVIEALTRGIVNKILHDPMVQLRAQQDIETRRHAMETLQLLFNLEPEVSSGKVI